MSNIKVGDLVIVAKPKLCCGSIADVGKIFVVEGGPLFAIGKCKDCGGKQPMDKNWVKGPSRWACHRSRLIKIDPLSEPESITKDEEVPA